MYAFTPGQTIGLVYEDFYLAIGYIFYESISALRSAPRHYSVRYVRLIPRDLRRLDLELFALPSRVDFLPCQTLMVL